MTDPNRTVHVVDDDRSFRTALARLLRAAGYEVCHYGSVQEFLAEDPHRKCGCVVADLQMPGEDGFDLQRELIRRGVELPFLFLSAHGDIPATVRAMREGAQDFLAKPVAKEQLLPAIEQALGRYRADDGRRSRLRELRDRYGSLTSREREVLSHVVGGSPNRQIAARLGVVERTVKAHRASLVSKLGADSLAELVRIADALGVAPAGQR